MNSLDSVREYLFGGASQIVALTAPVSPLEKRGLMRIEKRIERCSSMAYCPDGYHCISNTLCEKNINYAWTAVFAVLPLLCIILIWLRCRRARSAATHQTFVVTTLSQDPDYAVYHLQQQFAPPPGDPSMAYSTPASGSYAPAPEYTEGAYSAPAAPAPHPYLVKNIFIISKRSNYSTKKKVITHKKPEKGDEIKAICGLHILDDHQVTFVSSLMTALATRYLSFNPLW
ncbi:hypothetical protein BGZ99_009249 [Dissophora globulifera]|uniref:Uncharacterized protein n=1 Tax=Dissophora globulifera TaxID=979702 RepID=A0A9P6UMF6_9FUNG|nr:hypothetical protein BGZ99_009249 [Dissophora globulifera]